MLELCNCQNDDHDSRNCANECDEYCHLTNTDWVHLKVDEKRDENN